MKTQLIALSALFLATCDVLVGCDHDDGASADVAAAEPVDGSLDELVAKAPAAKLRSSPAEPVEVMPDAKQAFEQVVALVQEEYVEGPLAEDLLWSGATQGVLDQLVQLRGHPISALLDPKAMAELEAGTQGSIVGIGVGIELVGDVVVVRNVIAGGAAEEAKLQAGDRILGVDGERLKGLTLPEVVDRIRGEQGTNVSLFVQRDTEEWDETLVRTAVSFDSVEAQMLEGGVGLLKITSFAKRTAEEARAHLQTLSDEGMTSLVLDLRKCPGGLLEPAIETASLLLPPGKEVVVLERRDSSDVRRSEGTSPWQSLPVVTLVGPHTASGAEIVVEALAAADRTVVVGEETTGKATVESIHQLENGWSLKLSVSRFHAPGSDRAVGEGVQPDLVIPPVEDPERDVQLDAARQLLE